MHHSPKIIEPLLHEAYRYAFALTHSQAEAEDLVQEACLAVLKAGGPWTRAYLFSAVRSRFIDACRSTSSRSVSNVKSNGSAASIACQNDRLSQIESSETQSMLSDALARLKPEEREVLYLHNVMNMSVRHIAHHVNRKRGSLLSLLSRSRQKLARILESSQIGIRP